MFNKENFMKSHYLILIILFYSCSNKTTTHCYNVATKNIIYKGLTTPLIISSNKKIIEISTDKEATIEKGNSNDKFTLLTNQSEDLIINVKTKNTTDKFHFRVKEIPEPIINFNRPIKNNEIKVELFKTIKNISFLIPDISIDFAFRIKTIEIIRISKNNEVFREICNVKDSKLISLAEVGDIFIFDNIVIEYGEPEKIAKKSEILKIIE
jgi:hypothetical protein